MKKICILLCILISITIISLSPIIIKEYLTYEIKKTVKIIPTKINEKLGNVTENLKSLPIKMNEKVGNIFSKKKKNNKNEQEKEKIIVNKNK